MNRVLYAQFVAAKLGKTGLTVTVSVDRVNRSTGAVTTLASGAAATEVLGGVYCYVITGADTATYDYVGVFSTADTTVDQRDVPALVSDFVTTPLAVDVVDINGEPATPDTGGGVGTGSGDTPIDHNGGASVTVDGIAASTDCMRFTSSGVGVDNVEIVAYLESDYDAGNRGATSRRGTTYTGSDGRWEEPLMLDGGTYTVLASKGGFLVDSMIVVVP